MQQIFGWVFAPIAWSLGVPGATADRGQSARHAHGAERVRRLRPARHIMGMIDPRSFTIARLPCCGFANFTRSVSRSAHRSARSGTAARPGPAGSGDDAGTFANFLTADDCGMLL
jgi:hypothetical protein